MLYHVPDREAAARELRRVLAHDGVCVAVTNGARHMTSLRSVLEKVVQESTPGWAMAGWAVELFSLENGPAQLEVAFDEVRCVRPAEASRVVVRDAKIVADYVASVADHYQGQVQCPWPEVVERVRREVQRVIDEEGAFVTSGDVGALVCR
jgi:SAM-dependent methyltransferase